MKSLKTYFKSSLIQKNQTLFGANIPTDRGFVYLPSIMDLFSRKIIAWRLSQTLEAKWVVECVLEAKKLRRTTQSLILHSDRGSQYVSGAYLEVLHKIVPSYSRKASPWQNACMEPSMP
jgi:putative transposase